MASPYHLVIFDFTDVREGRIARESEEKPGLRQLANKIPLALVSAGPTKELREQAKLRVDAPITFHFGKIASSDVGLSDASFWTRLIEETKVPPHHLLFVATGNHYLSAIQEAGIKLARLGDTPLPADFEFCENAGRLSGLIENILARESFAILDPEFLALPYPKRYLEGILLFNQREYYEAHEVWEERWHQVKQDHGDFYKGLIQLAVATLHWERGNHAGAQSLYKSGRDCLKRFVPTFLDLNVLEFMEIMEDYFEPFFEALRKGQEIPMPNWSQPPQIHLERY